MISQILLEIDKLLEKYRQRRIPPLEDLVRRNVIDTVYQGYTDAQGKPMAILWPKGDPRDRASWDNPDGLNSGHFHGEYCKACRNFCTPDGEYPLRGPCQQSDADHAWEAATKQKLIIYVCRNGMLDLALPIILEGETIAVLLTGQLVPEPSSLWDTTDIGDVPEKGTRVDLWKVCSSRIQRCQQIVGGYAKLDLCLLSHTKVTQESLSKYEQLLTGAGDILLELASSRLQLERHAIRDCLRAKLFEAPLERGAFWEFLRGWIGAFRMPESFFVIGLAGAAEASCATVTLSTGSTSVKCGSYPIAERTMWDRLHRLARGQPQAQTLTLSNLLRGCKLPAVRTIAVPLGRHGFLVYGDLQAADGAALATDERINIGHYGRDIGLLLDNIEQAHAKEDFLTYFSHELRSPINSASFTIDRMRRGRFSSDPKIFDDRCRRLQAQLKRLLNLIQGVWHMQSILSQQAKYAPVRTPLYEFLAHWASQAKEMSESDDTLIVVAKESLGGLPAVDLDPKAFELVVFNLLDNAVKYSMAGKEIRVFGRRESDSVILTFTNIGIRLPSPIELDVFERFVRTDEAKALAPHSAGIGLFLVKHVVEGHKGTVVADCQPHGSCDYLVKFDVRLPLRQ